VPRRARQNLVRREGRAKESMAVNATFAPSNGMSASDASPCELDTPSKPAMPSNMPSLPPNGQDVREPPAKDDGGAEGAKNRRGRMLKEGKDAQVAASAELDEAFLETFDPVTDSLLLETAPEDCCSPGSSSGGTGATLASVARPDTARKRPGRCSRRWNLGALPSMLVRLLPSTGGVLPGVNAPYLYFGMWRVTFAWHVEDMDLFSINYIHFGAPKFWYAMPQARANALEQTMKGAPPCLCMDTLR
jgi:hypothetical protein